jgi:hypothetical protein
MWVADIYCELAWVSERKGNLGEPRYRLTRGVSRSPGVAIDLLLYGDDQQLRHVRMLIHTDGKEIADRCIDLNVQLWTNAIEVCMILQTGKSFRVALGEENMVMVALLEGDQNSPAPSGQLSAPANPLDYRNLALGMAAWNADLKPYVFYLRRLIDIGFPLDVRWLHGYRLLEWHFVQSKAQLQKSAAWRTFLGRFATQLQPLAKRNQSLWGLIEEARAAAAHAGIDDRPEAERLADPMTVMQKTFRTLEEMVMTVLNEHPATANGPVRFHRRPV